MTPPARRLRVNHWSPWGSDASGIANYAHHLVPALDRHLDVTVVHPHEIDPFYRTIEPKEVDYPTLDDADVDIFHIGNHLSFHHWMVAPLMRRGGIAVLHDWSIFDLMRPMFYRSLAMWQRELRYNHESDPGLAQHRGEPGFLMAHPMNRRILEAADVVVTHTPWARDRARELHPELDIRYVPLAGPTMPPSDPPIDAQITVLGGIGRHKQIEVAIDAFADVANKHSAARLRIVGRGDDDALISELKALCDQRGIAERVEWHLDVSRERYLELIEKSLVVITLRSDTAGEMSGVMVEAWGVGRAVITSDQPQFRSFDDIYCRRIPIHEGAREALATLIDEFLEHPEFARDAGSKARHHIQEEGSSFDAVAQHYVDIVEEITNRPHADILGGINVFGSWGTPSGLVEGVRRLSSGLLDAHVPITMPWAFRLPKFDPALIPKRFASVSRDRRYAINLLTANINEFHVVRPEILGTKDSPRWNIGMWIYEFPEIPDVLIERFELVDEIWAGSHFAADVFRRYFDGPIRTLPYVVEPRPQFASVEDTRRRFGLRQSATVVMFTFDFASGWARKNPLAVVRAFGEATRVASGVDAQLVIKVSGLTPEYRSTLRDAMGGMDAVLIDEHLSDADLGDLFHAIDVYCSLHRAEGFGLGMAEAMAIGKLAIGTDYSGNLDFMNRSNSLLVTARPSRLTEADAEANPGLKRIATIGTRWAEPDHASAVDALVRSFDADLRSELGAVARSDIAKGFSAAAATEVVRQRLSELETELLGHRTNWPTRSA